MSWLDDLFGWWRPKPPKPPVPPPVVTYMRAVRATLNGFTGRPASTLTIDIEGKESLVATWIPESGLLDFVLPDNWPAPFGVTIVVRAYGYEEFRHHFALANFADVPPDSHNPNLKVQTYEATEPAIVLNKKVILGRLYRDGHVYRTDQGPHTIIQMTAFRDLQRMIAGETDQLREVYSQAQALGFNDRRVFSTGANDFVQLEPTNPIYWVRAHQMLELGAEYGQRFTVVVLVDVHKLGWTLQQQLNHWLDWGAIALQHTNLRLSLVNEVDQTPNVIDPMAFRPIPGVICLRGSHGGTNPAVPGLPMGAGIREPGPDYSTWWDGEECHSNGQKKGEGEEQRVPAHLCLEMNQGEGETKASRVPAECSEMSRFADQWGGYTNLKQIAFDIGQSSALLGAGSCFHCIEGRVSSLLGAALPYAMEFARGALSVPLRFQKGIYWHAQELEGPDDLRVYQRILGAERFTATIHKRLS